MSSVDPILSALADPTRRGVIELLRKRPRRAGELAEAFGMSAPAMSRHLRVLRTRGIIEETRVDADARVRIYRLCPGPFSDLGAWLEDVRKLWGGQLESFRAHAERRGRR